ncbi:MAG: hypothetical protein JW769_04415 [Parachlamydiales bacterium]|nr:hypothetical protein [Parachlamydiales bacterium]
MKKCILIVLALGLFTGCQTKTGTGALAGGVLGAGTGALIGGGKGAAIGGAVGALSGGLIGAALDDQDRKIMEEQSPRTVQRMDRQEPLTINDIIKLAQGGVSDDTIIRYIDDTNTRYNLSEAQVDRLHKGGVSQRVINYMINTGR